MMLENLPDPNPEATFQEYREFGLIFCDVDKKLVRHIDPGLTLERPMTIYSVEGDECPYCKFVVTCGK
ncbi:MAG: hypothetical protein ACE5LX_01665 [Nitrospinota bacterium]